ncbi:hypothetical protein HOY82DRAFT_609523 [Tuber indicum]|nr:hypothetical protein HOY82DRAFT_609523 [Tuber indicum]
MSTAQQYLQPPISSPSTTTCSPSLISNSGNRGGSSPAMHHQIAASLENKGSARSHRQRERDWLDPAAVYVKSREALGRCTDTGGDNPQVDHLHSPLANALDARLTPPGNVTVLSASAATPFTELAVTISGIPKESITASERSVGGLQALQNNKQSGWISR